MKSIFRRQVFDCSTRGEIFTPYWDQAVVAKPSPWGGTNWPPSSYDPSAGLPVCLRERPDGTIYGRGHRRSLSPGRNYTQGLFGFSDIPPDGVFAAVDMRSNKIVWRQRWKDSCYSGSPPLPASSSLRAATMAASWPSIRAMAMCCGNFRPAPVSMPRPACFSTRVIKRSRSYPPAIILPAARRATASGCFRFKVRCRPRSRRRRWPRKATAVTLNGGNPGVGAHVFAQYCAACHGEEGKGGHGAGPNITKVVALELVANTVISGKNNMPPFAATLTFAQIRDVAAFVATQLGK